MVRFFKKLKANGRFRLQKAFQRDERGVSAIEFAMLFPLMVTMYFGSIDISQVLTADRKTTNLASTMADLVAQADVLTRADLDDIYSAATEIISPFPNTDLTIVVTSIETDDDGDPVVGWSDAYHGTPRSSTSGLTIPDGMITDGGSVIVAEVTYLYDSIITKFVGTDFEIDDTFFLRPRQGDKITFEP